MARYQQLRVYRSCYELTRELYRLRAKLPKALKYDLGSTVCVSVRFGQEVQEVPRDVNVGCGKLCGVKRKGPLKKLGGRAESVPVDWRAADRWLKTIRELRPVRGVCPRGLYRFRTMEEADRWMTSMMARMSRGSPE